jgi:Family of unknown function (DUF5362)
METTEIIEPNVPNPGLILTFEAQTYLRQAAKWANFLSIIGFIGCGFILIASFFVGGIFSRVSESPYGGGNPMFSLMAGMGTGITIFYILIGVWYFFFCFYLNQFASKIKRGVAFADSTHVAEGLSKLKSFFKLWGISTIIIISLYILAFIIFIGLGVAMLHR